MSYWFFLLPLFVLALTCWDFVATYRASRLASNEVESGTADSIPDEPIAKKGLPPAASSMSAPSQLAAIVDYLVSRDPNLAKGRQDEPSKETDGPRFSSTESIIDGLSAYSKLYSLLQKDQVVPTSLRSAIFGYSGTGKPFLTANRSLKINKQIASSAAHIFFMPISLQSFLGTNQDPELGEALAPLSAALETKLRDKEHLDVVHRWLVSSIIWHESQLRSVENELAKLRDSNAEQSAKE